MPGDMTYKIGVYAQSKKIEINSVFSTLEETHTIVMALFIGK